MNKKISTVLVVVTGLFLCLWFTAEPLFGWSSPIRITNDKRYLYEKAQLRYSPSGNIYIAYSAKAIGSNVANIFLSKYDGTQVQFIKDVSETGDYAYEADIGISQSGQIHMAWVECNLSTRTTQYIKYRSFNGSTWSTTQTLAQIPVSSPPSLPYMPVEDFRIAVDHNNNVFIVFVLFPAGQCKFISKYGGTVSYYNFSVSGRSKHPDVVVNNSYVYIAWQHRLSSGYTILSQKKENSPSGRWLSAVDLRHYETQRPRIDVDSNSNQHIVYFHDIGSSRKMFYKYWQGGDFSQSQAVSDNYADYHFADFVIKGSQMIATMQSGAYFSGGRGIYYNWAQNGVWGGLKVIPGTTSLRPVFASVDISPAGKAAVAFASVNVDIYLILSEGEGPEPPPPPPNVPPKALFSFSPNNGLYPLNVTFDAGKSSDSDGQIVSYNWDFGDKHSGSGVKTHHVFAYKNRFRVTLTVTDDDGASDSASGEIEVFGLYPPLNVQYKRHENRNLFSIEYLYRITWSNNPQNEAIGAKIVAFKIYRREKGQSGYTPFVTLPVGNQTNHEYLDRTLGTVAKQYSYMISALDSAGRESDPN